MNWTIFFTAVSTAMSVSAFLLSIIIFYKTLAPIDIEISSCELINAEIGYFNENMQFVNVISDLDDKIFPFYIISIRIINPRNYPISIFNINLIDEKNNKLTYYKKMIIPYYSEIPKLIAKNSNTSIGLNLPYSHYETLSAGTFSHVDIVVPLNEVQCYKAQSLIVTFRSSNKSFFHTKHKKVKSNVKMKYPIHYREFKI